MSFELTTPVVLLCFNRPQETAQVMARIRDARPPRLYVVSDAPRANRPDDTVLCNEVRDIATAVDWPCDLVTDFAEENMGCRLRVSSGLTKAFRADPELIILEDDCVPDPSFFRFCQELLERYRGDERVFAISGDNFQRVPQGAPSSYYFSQIFHCWGWASWRSQWESVDLSMDLWPAIRDARLLEQALAHVDGAEYLRRAFDETHAGKNSSWAYRASFSSIAQHKVNIHPAVNLVQNIGFGPEATHTAKGVGHLVPPAHAMRFPLVHPSHMIISREADGATFSAMNGRSKNPLKRLAKNMLRQLPLRIAAGE